MEALLSLTERHTLTYADASARLHKLGVYLIAKYGLKVIWVGDRVRVIGRVMLIKIDVTVQLLAGRIELTGADPGVLWRAPAENFLREAVQKYLDPLVTIDSLPAA
jgi:hypothetical protein